MVDPLPPVFTIVVAIAHLLAVAGWVGAMGYSLFVVQPRAAAFFAGTTDGDEQLELFVTALARRQRGPVLSSLATLALTGATLIAVARPRPTSSLWTAAVAVQSGCWLAALLLFSHVSWRLWPARVFALPAERPTWRRRFRRAGLTLFALAVTASIAGVVASFARRS